MSTMKSTPDPRSARNADPKPEPTPKQVGDQRNRARGRWGENLAASFYQRIGCRVIDRNWRSPTGELDLVVLDGETYVFSEVKTRRNDHFGPAAAAVGIDKQRRIRQLGVEWLRAHDLGHVDVRFDVVAITGNDLDHVPDAF